MAEVAERAGAPVVTLFESFGSGAEDIGSRVAQALGVPFHEQAFSSQQLEENAKLREKEGLLARALSAMGQSSFGGVDVDIHRAFGMRIRRFDIDAGADLDRPGDFEIE